jgi:hypothetical protein
VIASVLFAAALAAAAAAAAAPVLPASAKPAADCIHPAVVLWGDGRHDDTAALNAWLRGENALWGDSGAPVGAAIVGHDFRLSAAIYVTGGTGRMLDDFRLHWPERGETVTGGTIRAGADADQASVVSGVRIVGGDTGEGKAFDTPDPARPAAKRPTDCGIS